MKYEIELIRWQKRQNDKYYIFKGDLFQKFFGM